MFLASTTLPLNGLKSSRMLTPPLRLGTCAPKKGFRAGTIAAGAATTGTTGGISTAGYGKAARVSILRGASSMDRNSQVRVDSWDQQVRQSEISTESSLATAMSCAKRSVSAHRLEVGSLGIRFEDKGRSTGVELGAGSRGRDSCRRLGALACNRSVAIVHLDLGYRGIGGRIDSDRFWFGQRGSMEGRDLGDDHLDLGLGHGSGDRQSGSGFRRRLDRGSASDRFS